jgi:hypothetical protein
MDGHGRRDEWKRSLHLAKKSDILKLPSISGRDHAHTRCWALGRRARLLKKNKSRLNNYYTTTAAFSSPTRRKRVSAGSYIMTPMSSLRCIFPLNDGWQLGSRGGEGEGSIDKSYVDDGARGSIEMGRILSLHGLGSGRCTISAPAAVRSVGHEA